MDTLDGPRACLSAEFQEVISLINQTFRKGTSQDIRTDYPLIFDPSKLEYMRVIKMDGVIVSQVPVAPRRVIASKDQFTMGIISATITDPDYRRNSYGTLCLKDCIRIMENEGWPLSVLWTVEETFPFYQNSGWEAVGSQGWVYQLGPDDFGIFEGGSLDVVRCDPAESRHLDAIMTMHEAEPYRIARSSEDYRTLFSLPGTSTYLSLRGEEITSYLMSGYGVNKPGLIEAGGDPDGLEALVRHVLLEEGRMGGSIQAIVPKTPTVLGNLMELKVRGRGRPVEEANGVGHQMVRINSLEKLLRGIEYFLCSKSAGITQVVSLKCPDSGEAVTLDFQDGTIRITPEIFREPIVLNRRDLVKLIFGCHPSAKILATGMAGGVLNRIFPFYFPVWELDHA